MTGGRRHGDHAVWASLVVPADLGLGQVWLLKVPLGWRSSGLPRAGEQDGEIEAQIAPPPSLVEGHTSASGV